MINFIIRKIKNQKIRFREWYSLKMVDKAAKGVVFCFDNKVFSGKRIAIVGGADSAFQHKLGDYIDSFDIIIRVNNGVRLIDKYGDYIGSKTDFLFHALRGDRPESEGGSPINVELWKDKKVRNVVFPYNYRFDFYNLDIVKNFLSLTNRNYPIFQVSTAFNNKLYEALDGHSPTTGFVALASVLESDFNELYITGFSFFKTAHHADYRSGDINFWAQKIKNQQVHNPELELKYLQTAYTRLGDEKIKMDPTLYTIINE